MGKAQSSHRNKTTDIDYFFEDELRIGGFYQFMIALPTHLRKHFDNANHVNTNHPHFPHNILFGYQGPAHMRSSRYSSNLEPHNGVQEIKYWWAKQQYSYTITDPKFDISKTIEGQRGEVEWSTLYFDNKTGMCLSHSKIEAAEKLNNIGLQLFNEGKFSEAVEYFGNAFNLASLGSRQQFANNRDRAKNQIEAIKLNMQGDDLYNQGKFTEAQIKYQEAAEKSSHGQYTAIYKANINRTQNKVAQNLYLEGNVLRREEKYNEALAKYEAALKVSHTAEIHRAYTETKENIEKISVIETLWKNAWDAENDTKTDRSDEAERLFQEVLQKTTDFITIFPNNSKLKQYRSLVVLKIDGNASFNQGLVLQQAGMDLFDEAEVLKEQQKYELAGAKFEEAKTKFVEAKEKFEDGIARYRKFLDSVNFVKEQIEKIEEIIRTTEMYSRERLTDVNIRIVDNDDTNEQNKATEHMHQEIVSNA